jgi:hypothetical protein
MLSCLFLRLFSFLQRNLCWSSLCASIPPHTSTPHPTPRLPQISELGDPCPTPAARKRRSLNDQERLLYAPMSDVGGLLFDKDAMYIEIPDWKVGLGVRACVCVYACLGWRGGSCMGGSILS